MALLILEDGSHFSGIPFEFLKQTHGEVVFQTGMVGYVECLTDPSYLNQILVFTYPIIGNYGKIHVAGIVVSSLCPSNHVSNYHSDIDLNSWLIKNEICGIEITDTRQLVRHISVHGSLPGKIVISSNFTPLIPKIFISAETVSVTSVKYYESSTSGPKIIAVDCGMKNNLLRSFLLRGINVQVVPINYDFFTDISKGNIHGLFLSNGPGDPILCCTLIIRLKSLLNSGKNIPIFGVCLGHQILALASGLKTFKMKFGHHGHNHPCKDTITGNCFVTSQNHGYAVESNANMLTWKTLFKNLNDDTNEGLYHEFLPYFSIQFHPERKPGPTGTEFIFDIFFTMIEDFRLRKVTKKFENYYQEEIHRIGLIPDNYELSKFRFKSSRRVLVLGSGGLVIGQAGEFDYSGSQAIKALKEDNMYVILINPNIATSQTSKNIADSVYFLPIQSEFVEKVIEAERPDAILLSVGGQTALNCGIALYDKKILQKYNVEVLGTSIDSITSSENREKFSQIIKNIGFSVPPSHCAESIEEAIEISKNFGYPLLIRSSFSLGGSGSGLATNEKTFIELVCNAFADSPQVIIDKYLIGWKEVEYEILRDCVNNSVIVCNMENIDPIGIHTGDSIVIAPSQTLTDEEYHTLRQASIQIARHFNIIGECNIQFALCPHTGCVYIIEINARLSRSSALASKATGYPIAYISTKLALGHPLDTLKNVVTKSFLHPEGTCALFEPSLDYIVIKVPKWDFEKFVNVDQSIGTSMKSVGEVMAIGRDFREALQKALRMVDPSRIGLNPYLKTDGFNDLLIPSSTRIHGIATAFYNDLTIDEVHQQTFIDRWFLNKIKDIVDEIKYIKSLSTKISINKLSLTDLKNWKKHGFCDKQIKNFLKCHENKIQALRLQYDILPFVKRIDTVAGEYPSITNYFYLTYNASEHDATFQCSNAVMVLGSGPYRIGSSVEFDCSSVLCIRELRRLKRSTIMLNCNPETVSTDFDECDRMYFDELTPETISAIYNLETPEGIIICMSGQTPNNIAFDLQRLNLNILGTQPCMIDNAENRFKFSRLLDELNINQPTWKELTTYDEAQKFCQQVGYPCLVRPSYVLSGEAMNVAFCDSELIDYLTQATKISRENPVIITKFIQDCKELDVDGVAHLGKVICMSIAEHIEHAGVHSGDSTLIIPPKGLNDQTYQNIRLTVSKIVNSLHVNGPFNLQLIAKDNNVEVIECNLRVSRTFPLCSKAHDVDFVAIATRCILNISSVEGFQPFPLSPKRYAVKVPQFSFRQLKGAEVNSGVEMHSTGEVACFGQTSQQAFLKACLCVGISLPNKGIFVSIEPYKMKLYLLESFKNLIKIGYQIFTDEETHDFFSENGIMTTYQPLGQMKEFNSREMSQYLHKKGITLIVFINYQSCFNRLRRTGSKGYLLARFAVDNAIPIITNAQSFKFFADSLDERNLIYDISREIDSVQSGKIIRLPYLVDCHTHMREPGQVHKEDFLTGTTSALAGGISCILCMPNTNPPLLDQSSYELANSLASQKCVCDYGLIAGGSKDNPSNHDFLSRKCSALKLYLNETFTTLQLNSVDILIQHFKLWPENLPIMVHAEGSILATALYLSLVYKRKLHVCHVSKKSEIELIRNAKKHNIDVTCEVSPHHLFLTQKDSEIIGESKIRVKPELGSEEDQKALWENLDIIDCFGSDHAPHTLSEKAASIPGFPGVETMLPLLLTAVNQKRITIEDVILRLHTNPLKIFNIPDQPNSFVEVDMERKSVITASQLHSKADWTPFEGFEVSACVDRVIIRGNVVFVGNKLLVEPGFGKNVVTERSLTTFSKTPTPSTSVLLPPIEKSIICHNESSLTQDLLSKLLNSNHANWFHRRSLIGVKIFDYPKVKLVLNVARELKGLFQAGWTGKPLEGKILALAFIEPSTRTMLSFQAAMQRLGGTTLILQSECSIVKGETFEDTVRALSSFADGIVIRHNIAGTIASAAKVSRIPVFNGGDGIGEHPSQAILDFLTIREELGSVHNLNISLVGDLKNGRTTHSFALLSVIFRNITINFVSPEGLEMPQTIKDHLSLHGVVQRDFRSLKDVIQNSDVIYMTRIQKERFSSEQDYLKYKGQYILTPEILSLAKQKMIVMHPLPRIDEIDKNLDFDPRSVYFKQMEYGMYARMALLLLILGNPAP